MSEYKYIESGAGLTIKTKFGWLTSIQPNFTQAWSKSGSSWLYEKRPKISFNFKLPKLADISNSFRYRAEYRDKEDSWSDWRHRYRLKMAFKSIFLKPWIADEVFYSDHASELNRNRIYLGVGGKIFNSLNWGLTYWWQRDKKSGDWIDSDYVNLKIAVKG